MTLGYDRQLYILAFDHRGSFTKRFGIEGEPAPGEIERISDGKHLIFEGLEAALARGADPSVTGALVDEQFGGPTRVPEQVKAARNPTRDAGREERAERNSTSSTATTSGPISNATTRTSPRSSFATTRTATPR